MSRITVGDIYHYLDQMAPFETQEKYDNSALLVGDMAENVGGIMLALDITREVITEAADCGANLIVSHHPVIFDPVKRLNASEPPYMLARRGINAICAHTNMDLCVMNSLTAELLGFSETQVFLEPGPDKTIGAGMVLALEKPYEPRELAAHCKAVFRCPAATYTDGGRAIKKIAVCSGSGGFLLEAAVANHCHAFITGETKHSARVYAHNAGLTLIECGHFYTENILMDHLAGALSRAYPELMVKIADSNCDICAYI